MHAPRNDAREKIPARTWKIAAVAGAAAFMAMLDATVVNLALESIGRDFDTSLNLVQWVATGYLIALAVSLPTAGWLGNRYGYGRIWRSAVTGFVIASVLCGLAPTPGILIMARVAQGLAAGLMVPAGQAVIGSTTRANQLGRVMGTLGLVIALGPALGPGLGGYLLEATSWRGLFWINVPVGIVALLGARGRIPLGATNAGRPLDRLGLVLVGVGLPLLLYGATKIGAGHAGGMQVLALVLGAVLMVGFVRTELRTRHPLIDLRLLRGRVFSAATLTTGLTGANMYAGLLLLPVYLQLATDRSVAETGLLLLAMGLGSAAMLPVAGVVTDRFGADRAAMGGAIIAFVSTAWLALVPSGLSTSALMLLLVLRGMGIALAQMPAMTAAYASVANEEMGDAATLVNMVQRIGGAGGAVGMVVLLAACGHPGRADCYVREFVALSVLALLTLISAAWLRPRERKGTDSVIE